MLNYFDIELLIFTYLMLHFWCCTVLRLPYVMLHYMLHILILHYFDIALFDVA